MKLHQALNPLLALVAVAALSAAPSLLSKAQLFSLTDVLVLGLFATSYNVLLGYGGLLSFGHSAYFGIGAYSAALVLMHQPGLPPPVAIAFGALAGALGGVVVGAVCVRRSGPYFSMLTLAFGMLFYTGAWKWRSVTQGDDGFGGFVPSQWWFPIVGTIRTGDFDQLYRVTLILVAALLAVIWVLMSTTAYGNAVRSVKQNEERASFLGYNVFVVKLVNYVLASAIAGVAGSLFVISHNFVSTDVIGLERSTEVVMMTYIGGTAAFLGPMFGSAFVVLFGDFLASVTDRWQLIMGVLFVLMVMYAPRGFSGPVQAVTERLSRPRSAQARVPTEDAPRYTPHEGLR